MAVERTQALVMHLQQCRDIGNSNNERGKYPVLNSNDRANIKANKGTSTIYQLVQAKRQATKKLMRT